jgi:hypothetical protein
MSYSLSTLTGTTRYWLANAHQYHLETIFVSLSDRFTPTNGSLCVAITLLISSQRLDIEVSLQDYIIIVKSKSHFSLIKMSFSESVGGTLIKKTCA